MEIFPLRPHHAVCLLGFRGKGYDEKFVEEMGKVWRSLKEGKGQVRLVEGCDVLCKHCPQRVENGCTDEQRILRLDRAFANRLDLRVGKLLSWKDMEKKQRRLTLSAFEKICASCQWISICRRELFCRHKGGVFKPSAKYPF